MHHSDALRPISYRPQRAEYPGTWCSRSDLAPIRRLGQDIGKGMIPMQCRDRIVLAGHQRLPRGLIGAADCQQQVGMRQRQ